MSTNELRRRLRDVVELEYGGSARAASRAMGLNPNLIGDLLKDERRIPDRETLEAFAAKCDWPLRDVVAWALGFPPDEPDVSPLAEMDRGMARLGLPGNQRKLLREMALALASAQGQWPSSE
jgi:hypothetical protein